VKIPDCIDYINYINYINYIPCIELIDVIIFKDLNERPHKMISWINRNDIWRNPINKEPRKTQALLIYLPKQQSPVGSRYTVSLAYFIYDWSWAPDP